jgi:hypothetical protein
VENYDWDLLTRFAESTSNQGQMNLETIGIDETQKKLQRLIEIGSVMAKKYWVTCTNPPYMGSNNMSAKLFDFVGENYIGGKTDLYIAFIQRCMAFTLNNGYTGMITQQGWMFLSSLEDMRIAIQMERIVNLLQLGARAFDEISGEVVQTAAFVINLSHYKSFLSTFIQLVKFAGEKAKETAFFDSANRTIQNTEYMKAIPGEPIAYWCSKRVYQIFEDAQPLSTVLTPRQGVKTLDNNRFLKLWFEPSYGKIGFGAKSLDEANSMNVKWFPYNKGGTAIKWYGNNDYVVNWENDGQEMKANAVDKYKSVTRTITNISYFFRNGITWSDISTGNIAIRIEDYGFIFDSTGNMAYGEDSQLSYIAGLMNSKIMMLFMKILAPTLHFNGGAINNVPLLFSEDRDDIILRHVEDCRIIAKQDWDAFETSWDFKEHPLVEKSKGLCDATAIGVSMQYYYGGHPKISCPVELCWMLFQGECNERFNQLKSNEEELNRIFIDIYGLQDELTPEEDDSDVTVRKADLPRDIKSLISYAVGCILGRYSLDVDGLAYAGGEWDASKYTTFQPDADNVIPITDARYMDDDIVDRFCEWLTVVYGADTLEENLDFISKVLGTKGTDSRDIIRNYFLNDFFKDHCQTYSVTGSGKRPIYWLFDSGKQNGFKALIYMHRYNADTIGRVRVSYLHPLQEKYENEVRSIDTMIDHMSDQRQIASEEKRREKLIKQIAEVKEYDERLDHLAQEHIDIDLDDGVKVNYEKIQTDRDGKIYQILAPIK